MSAAPPPPFDPPGPAHTPDLQSPRPKRIATPTWLDLRLVLGVVLVLASVLVGAKIVSGAGDTSATVATRRDLAAGTVLTRDDLEMSQVRLPDGRDHLYLRSFDDAVGRRLTRASSRGELLPAASIATVPAQTTLTVPLTAGAAPTLKTGQRIELFVSSAACPSLVLLPEVVVQSVRSDADNSFGGGSGAQNVVVSVDPAQAGRVVQALALDGATVRAGVLVGTSAPSSPGLPARSSSGQSSAPISSVAPSQASPTSPASGAGDDLGACAASDAPR